MPDSVNRPLSHRAAVHFGTGMESINEVCRTSGSISERRYSGIGPHALTRGLGNMSAGNISRIWGLRGPCMACNTACATGLHSIGDAYRLIQYGEADLVVAGGCEASVLPWSVAAFSRIRALSTKFNDNPSMASRPFDKQRDGFVISEGSGAMVMQAWPPTEEMKEFLLTGGGSIPTPIAEVIGYGRSADAYNLVSPDPCGDGAFRCMNAAIQDAKTIKIDDIGHINCHATSTPLGDAIELAAIARLVATRSRETALSKARLLINSIKGHTGHALGAAGAIESVYTALSVSRGLVAATCNLQNPIDSSTVENVLEAYTGNDDLRVSDCLDALEQCSELPKAEHLNIPFLVSSYDGRRIAMTNAFGFGGTNGTLLIAEWKD